MPEGEALAPRILIVDDSPVLAELVERLLSSEGMAPVKCSGGREALAILDAGRFDAVILDIVMPEVDGYEVLRQMRLTTRTAHLPVILLSGKSRPEDVEKGLEMGATYYLTKPFKSPTSSANCARAFKSERRWRPRIASDQAARRVSNPH